MSTPVFLYMFVEVPEYQVVVARSGVGGGSHVLRGSSSLLNFTRCNINENLRDTFIESWSGC